MGYTTRFSGKFKTDRPIDAETYLELQDIEVKVDSYPENLYWQFEKDRRTIRDGSEEKWRSYVEQLQWLAEYLFAKGYRIEGFVHYGGEEITDAGTLAIAYCSDGDVTEVVVRKIPAHFETFE